MVPADRAVLAGWVVARSEERLVGFVSVLWDGRVHARIQDLMVAPDARRSRPGTELVGVVIGDARSAGCL